MNTTLLPVPDTEARLRDIAGMASLLALAYGHHDAAYLGLAATLLPRDRALCAADVYGAVTDAASEITGTPRPVAAHLARPAHDVIAAVVADLAPWLRTHPDPVGEYVRESSRTGVVALLLRSAMRAARTGGAS